MKKIVIYLVLLCTSFTLQAQWGGIGNVQYWNGVTPVIRNSFPALALVNTDLDVTPGTIGNLTFGRDVPSGVWGGAAQLNYNYNFERFQLRHIDAAFDAHDVFSFYLNKEDADSNGRGLFIVGEGDEDRLTIDPNEIQAFNGVFNIGTLSLNPGGGFVGVGTYNPLEKLHVEDGRMVVEAEICINPGDFSTGYDLFNFSSRKGSLSFDQTTGLPFHSIEVNAFNDGIVQLRTENQTRMTVQTNGQIGVGTIAPLEKFHVENGRYIAEAELSGLTTSAFTTGYDLYNGTTRKGGLSYFEPFSTGASLHTISLNALDGGSLAFSTGGSTRMVVKPNGNVGINTNTPAYTLEVNGDGYVSGEFTAMSDLKVKKNIKPILNATNLVNQLNPVTYQFKSDEYPALHLSDGQRWGVIAQELEQVLPDLVVDKGSTIDKDGNHVDLKSVNYLDMIPILLKAIQEQNTLIETQTKTLEAQDARISLLESKLK